MKNEDLLLIGGGAIAVLYLMGRTKVADVVKDVAKEAAAGVGKGAGNAVLSVASTPVYFWLGQTEAVVDQTHGILKAMPSYQYYSKLGESYTSKSGGVPAANIPVVGNLAKDSFNYGYGLGKSGDPDGNIAQSTMLQAALVPKPLADLVARWF